MRLESKARTQLLRLSYGTTQDGRDRYQFEFTHMKDGYYLTAIQGYQPTSKDHLESKQLKKAALTSLASGKEKAGMKLEDILQKVGLPQSLFLNHKDGKTVFGLDLPCTRGAGLSHFATPKRYSLSSSQGRIRRSKWIQSSRS